MSRYSVVVIFFLIISQPSISQPKNSLPEVGKPCPDFVLNEIHQYKLTKASIRDFRGKPLIIDFFTQYCTACFKSFPKINNLQKEYKNEIQFLLVGFDKQFEQNARRGIRDDYEQFQKHYGIDIPVAYDSVTVKRFKLMVFPYVIWVDGKGIVQAITTSTEITKENIKKFIAGQQLDLPIAQNTDQMNEDTLYNWQKPLLINGNGGKDTDYIYRSVLMNWNRHQGFMYDMHISSDNMKNIQGVGFTAFNLFRLAYIDSEYAATPPGFMAADSGINHYGQWYLKPVFENMDTSLFNYDLTTGKNLFSYCLSIPAVHSVAEAQKKMQSDLKSYFNIQVTIEKRKMPYWKLIVIDSARANLVTKGNRKFEKYSQSGFSLVNQPITRITRIIFCYNQNEVIEDETGISSNIDIEIDTILPDLNDVKKELNKQGLDLVRGTKEMKTMVFSNVPN
jgi:thiol-disulfide isomerase/thioredoxin